MEPQFKQLEDPQGQQDSQDISGIGRALGEDVSKLMAQHLDLLKLESQAASKKLFAGFVMAGFAAILLALGVLRLIESAVYWLAAANNWQTPQAIAAVTALILIALAAVSGLIGRQLLLKQQTEKNVLIQEMKEDWRWLQKMFT